MYVPCGQSQGGEHRRVRGTSLGPAKLSCQGLVTTLPWAERLTDRHRYVRNLYVAAGRLRPDGARAAEVAGGSHSYQEGAMSIPLTRSNLYRYLMNIVVEADDLSAPPEGPDPEYQGKIGSAELARQLIEDFSLAPDAAGKQ